MKKPFIRAIHEENLVYISFISRRQQFLILFFPHSPPADLFGLFATEVGGRKEGGRETEAQSKREEREGEGGCLPSFLLTACSCLAYSPAHIMEQVFVSNFDGESQVIGLNPRFTSEVIWFPDA